MATATAAESEETVSLQLDAPSNGCSSPTASRSRHVTRMSSISSRMTLGSGFTSFFQRTLTSQPMKATSTRDSRRLTAAVPKKCLRAVRLERALAGLGKHWQGSISGGLGIDADAQAIFELSEQVDGITSFLSHDWATGRWMKYITLIFVYNFKAAFLWSVLVALLVSLIEGGVLYGGHPLVKTVQVTIAGKVHTVYVGIFALVFPPCVFVWLLMFGQRFPRLTRCSTLPIMTFMDKMCIHQTDLELKAKAILSLAGFLRCSDRMVVLWSPRYLTRLWCVFEVASWTYLGKDFQSSAIFAPTTLYVGALGATVACYFFFDVIQVLLSDLVLWVFLGASLGVLLLVLPVPMRLLRRTVQDLGHMQHQFENFRVQSAECFCCEVGHKDPKTGEEIPCDRELVYSTLSHWFSKERCTVEESQVNLEESFAEVDQCYLDKFNEFVHETAGPALCSSIFSASSRYWLCLRVGTPVIWWMFSRWLVLLQVGGVDGFRYVIESVAVAFVVFPSLFFMAVRMASLFNRLGGEKALAGGARDTALTCLAVLAACAVACLLWGPLLLTRSMVSIVPQAIAYSVILLICTLNLLLPWRP